MTHQLLLSSNRPQSGRTNRARDSRTLQDSRHRSEKHLAMKREVAEEEPFYLKLSNSPKQPQRMRSEPKQELEPSDMMKRALLQLYSSQIAQKQQQKRWSRKRKIMEQRDYLSHFSKHQQIQAKHQQQQLSQHHNLLRQQINKRQIILQSIKTEELQSDRNYQPRLGCLIHKAESFRQFYEQAYLARQQAARQYEGYMKQEEQGEIVESQQQPRSAHPSPVLKQAEGTAERCAQDSAGEANCGEEGKPATWSLLQMIVLCSIIKQIQYTALNAALKELTSNSTTLSARTPLARRDLPVWCRLRLLSDCTVFWWIATSESTMP